MRIALNRDSDGNQIRSDQQSRCYSGCECARLHDVHVG